MYSDAKVKVTLKDGTKKTVELDFTSLAKPGVLSELLNHLLLYFL